VSEQAEATFELSEDRLFAQALTAPRTETVEEAIEQLRARGSRLIAERAMRMVQSTERIERLVGIDVLNDFGAKQNFPFREEYALILVAALDTDDELQLVRTISAVAKTGCDSALEPLLRLSRHRSNAVRLCVAKGLPSLTNGELVFESDPLTQVLLTLISDQDEEVRNWATFGIGSMVNVDGPTIRAALRAALVDVNGDARAEALTGLVRRRDPCSYDAVVRALTDESIGRLSVQAAAILGDERLTELLRNLTSWWDIDLEGLEWALYRCAPGRSQREVASMNELDRHFQLVAPGWSLAFESALTDGEISIRAQRAKQAVGPWSFQHLMESTKNKAAVAARRISKSLPPQVEPEFNSVLVRPRWI
jgi:HEAT repeat protein